MKQTNSDLGAAHLQRLAVCKVQPWISTHDPNTQNFPFSSSTPASFGEIRSEVPFRMQLHPEPRQGFPTRPAPDRIPFFPPRARVVEHLSPNRPAATLNPTERTPNLVTDYMNTFREHHTAEMPPLLFPEEPPATYDPNNCIKNWGSHFRRRTFYDPVRDESHIKSEPGTASDMDMAELDARDTEVAPAPPLADPMELSASPALTSSIRLATPNSSIAAMSESEPTINNTLNDQRRLFRALEKICLTATRIYWTYTRPSPRVYLRYSPHARRDTPYDRYLGNSRSSRRILSRRTLREIDAEDSRFTLRDLLSRICNQMWERAVQMDSRQEEELAVNRMMNLYSWAHCLGRATTKVQVEREALGEGDVVAVFTAARDMAGFLLFEEGREEVEELWGAYGFGGRMEDFEWQ